MILLNHKTGVDIFSDIEKYHRSFNGRDVFDEPLFLDQKLTLADLYLVKVDRASMANSLEVRSPMLDKDFVSLAAEIPFKLKVKGFNTKYLLKKIAADFLPSRVVYRKKKGFGIPLGELMDSILKPEVKKVFNCVAESGLLNKEALGKVFFNGTPQQVWSIFALGLWYLKWGDSKSGAIGDIIGKKTCAVFSE
jgi:asparagine synthase (glutamine-hydrolysing)